MTDYSILEEPKFVIDRVKDRAITDVTFVLL